MCGLVVLAPFDQVEQGELHGLLRRMTDAIRYRGPDDEGHWIDEDRRIGLGFRRLSIIDLSPAGHQPMASASGRYVIVFNGEIYNFEELRGAMQARGTAPEWRGHSDTEVILGIVDAVGPAEAIPRLNGMFAIAIYDRLKRELWLARDRLGKKPLYYGWSERRLIAASELKAFTALPFFSPRIDRQGLKSFIRLGYVPGDRSIYEGVFKLPAAHILRVELGDEQKAGALPQPRRYWSLVDVALTGQAAVDEGKAASQEEFNALFDDATKRRMVADVALGAFLSGGIDSSLVVARMTAMSAVPPKTFSIAFDEERWNEGPYARAIAEHLQTDHTEFLVTGQETLAVVDDLGSTSDEPFADASMIPTLIVCRLARKQVTVALSGDGGDEFFGGYDRYWRAAARARLANLIPRTLPPERARFSRPLVQLPRRWGPRQEICVCWTSPSA